MGHGFKHWKLWLWLLLALAVRLYKLTQVHCIAPDGTAYIEIAKGWLTGTGFHPTWPPLYPWTVSLLIRLGLEPELGGGLISVLFGVLTVGLVYILTKEFFSIKIAQISTIFAVFHPFLVRYSSEVLADGLFTFLVTLVVYLGWIALQRGGFIPAIFIGIGTALAYLTKPEGIFLIVVVSGWWLFTPLEIKGRTFNVDTRNRKSKNHHFSFISVLRIRLKRILFLTGFTPKLGWGQWPGRVLKIIWVWIICLVLSFPYLYSIRKETGRWMISQKQSTVFSIALQEGGYTDKFLNISPLKYAVTNPRNFSLKIGSDLLTLLSRFPDAYHPLLFIFLVIGLVHKWKPDKKKEFLYILSFLVPYFLGYAVYHPGRRYLVTWVPLTLGIAGLGWYRVKDWLDVHCRKKGFFGLEIALLFITIFILLPKTLEPVRKGGLKWKEAGYWIKEYAGSKISVMSEDSRVAFYGDGKHIRWSEQKLKDMEGVDYIVTERDISALYNLQEVGYTSQGLKIYRRVTTLPDPSRQTEGEQGKRM